MKHCELRFVCGKEWDNLALTEVAQARYCTDCRKAVFMVKTKPQLLVASALGRCVGIADDNDFIGVIGDPGSIDGFDWMEAGYFEEVTIKLSETPSSERLEQLRLLFPKLFDYAESEKQLLSGYSVSIGELGTQEREVLLGELKSHGPELKVCRDA